MHHGAIKDQHGVEGDELLQALTNEIGRLHVQNLALRIQVKRMQENHYLSQVDKPEPKTTGVAPSE